MGNVSKICKKCSSENVKKDAWCSWDIDKQEWVIESIFDQEYCDSCEGETIIIDKEIKNE